MVQFLVTPSEAQKNQPPSHVFAPPSLHLTRCMRFVFASTVLRVFDLTLEQPWGLQWYTGIPFAYRYAPKVGLIIKENDNDE